MQRFRLTIAQRIWIGFGLLILVMLIYIFFANRSLRANQETEHQVNETMVPALDLLGDLYNAVYDTRMLTRNWVLSEKFSFRSEHMALRMLQEEKIPGIDEAIRSKMAMWDGASKQKYNHVMQLVNDSLIPQQRIIMQQLPDEASYSNSLLVYDLINRVGERGSIDRISNMALDSISGLMEHQKLVLQDAIRKVDRSFENFRSMLNLMTVLLIVGAVFIAFLIIGSIVRPMNFIRRVLHNMSLGILPDEDIPGGKDEIGQMSVALNGVVKALKGISDFSLQIGKGNFDSDFKPLSEKDILGNALLDMREELKIAALEQEKRHQEDEQRNWATQGMAKFGEILRQDNNNITEFSQNIISHLVQYLNANQGGFFLISTEDGNEQFIELQAFYAYNKKKYLEKKIRIGEGLVGRCVQEKATIYLTDIPKDYIKITSGLGGDNPRSLILVPLMMNEQVYGVIEIASFQAFEPYQIEFMEKLAASIASTVSAVQINMQTAQLLEQSRQHTEEMLAQEEEMRQNMEELRATQEQSARREEMLEKKVKELTARLEELKK